ncbi:hypothetical protein A9798_00250 [Edwardsiella hoshinae]|uniref:DUF1454 family protein n=1 Tax=Edwardsiella hoshinae TaxID=93378 RepID=A0ABM6EN12_9GAMM|nr:hypothetical protein A9798_00250 [Edwardsiella hoshinae]
MRIALLSLLMLACLPLVSNAASSALTSESPTAAYLLPGAPTFDLTLVSFRTRYNQDFPALPLAEYRAISVQDENLPLTRAATRINQAIYSSVVLEKGTGKIKSLQITYLPEADTEITNEREKGKREAKNGTESAARQLAIRYMAAIMQSFSPTISAQQSLEKVAQLLSRGKNHTYYSQQDGSLRYVVADSGEKGITFAVEPIKLALSEDADPQSP